MVTHAEAVAQASAELAKKSAGPNGIIAYTQVNDSRRETKEVGGQSITYDLPFFNPDKVGPDNPTRLAYAFFETNRVGVPVVSAPGGTQDLLVNDPETGAPLMGRDKNGKSKGVELDKADKLNAALKALGKETYTMEVEKKGEIKTVPAVMKKDGQIVSEGGTLEEAEKNTELLEHYVATKAIEKGYRVRLEAPFEAAVREAEEEHGIDLSDRSSYIGAPKKYERQAMTKRTIQELEKDREPLFSMEGIHDGGDIAATIGRIEEEVGADNPKLRTQQALFAVQVPDFESVTPRDSGEKTEGKIKGRIGEKYYEKGQFVTLETMENQLEDAIATARAEEAKGNSFARQEIVATYERLQAFKRIEAGLVADLKATHPTLTTKVPEILKDTSDAELTEFAGTASDTETPGVRPISRGDVGEGRW